MATGLFIQDKDGWRKDDLEWGVKYGLGWKDGTSDKVLKDYEFHIESVKNQRNVDRLIELNRQLKEYEELEKTIKEDNSDYSEDLI